jgi:hypothetical protein
VVPKPAASTAANKVSKLLLQSAISAIVPLQVTVLSSSSLLQPAIKKLLKTAAVTSLIGELYFFMCVSPFINRNVDYLYFKN